MNSDEYDVYNNKNMMQNRQMDSIHNDLNSTEYIPPQQREPIYDIPTNRVQNNYNSFTPEVQNQQIDFENIPRQTDSRFRDTYNYVTESDTWNQRQQEESTANQVQDFDFKSVSPRSSDYINNEPSDKSDSDSSSTYNTQVHTSYQQSNSNKPKSYHSEWPTLSEASKNGESRKNSETDLGAWGQVDITSAWGKPKKWISETETKKPESKPPTNTWNPDDVNQFTWTPIQESKQPLFRRKRNAPTHFEFDDNEGWGTTSNKIHPMGR